MPTIINASDLEPFGVVDDDKSQAMVADALAMAVLVAPCLNDDDFAYAAAAKAIVRGAILRWVDAGSGALSQKSETRGPFTESETFDTRQVRRAMFWPSEIQQLQDLCKSGSETGAFSVDTAGCGWANHADICSINFGASYCSCGAVLTNLAYPLYEC